MKKSPPTRRPECRDQALEVATAIAALVKVLPEDEAARVACNIAVGRIRELYRPSRSQQLGRILQKIAAGNRSVFELAIATWYDRRLIESLLKELMEKNVIVERKEKPTGGLGRPCRKFYVQDPGLLYIGGT